MSWKDAFRRGAELFQQEQYEDALKAFDQAVCENDKDKIMFDSRAAVLEKLDRPFDALKDSKKVIDLAPTSWQGYARSARLFTQINKPESSLKMADLALERLKTADAKRCTELEALRAQALKALEPLPCYFSKMPVEIQSEILTLVVDKSCAKMLALTSVCRLWREIIINMPNLWRHFVLTRETTLKEADTWLERSKGILSSLCIVGGFSFAARPNVLRNASASMWSTLDVLEVVDWQNDFNGMLPPGAFEQLRLQSLELEIPKFTPNFLQALSNMNTSRTRKLALDVVNGSITLTGITFTALTTLEIRGIFRNNQLFALLKNNPMLETVIIGGWDSEVGRLTDPLEIYEHIKLANLRRLELFRCDDTNVCLRSILFPNLEVLIVEFIHKPVAVRSVEALASQRLTLLEELHLRKCTFSSTALISVLRAASALRVLRLSYCASPDEDESAVIEALAKTIPAEEKQNLSQTLCCPLLQHIDLSTSPRLKAGTIVRLIRAHLPSAVASSDSKPGSATSSGEPRVLPLPILFLNIDECPMIDPDVLPWLRANVPRLRCKMTLIYEIGKGRR